MYCHTGNYVFAELTNRDVPASVVSYVLTVTSFERYKVTARGPFSLDFWMFVNIAAYSSFTVWETNDVGANRASLLVYGTCP